MMTTGHFAFEEEPLDGGVRVFHLHGRLSVGRPCFEFQEQVCEAIKGDVRGVVIDLAGLEFLDSCGIGILASIVASSRKAGHPVVLAAAPPPVKRLLDVIWFLKIVDHVLTVEEGVRHVRTGIAPA